MVLVLTVLVALHQLPGRRFFFTLLWQKANHSFGVDQPNFNHPGPKRAAHIQGAKNGMLQRFSAWLASCHLYFPVTSVLSLVAILFPDSVFNLVSLNTRLLSSLFSFSRPPPFAL